MISLGDETRSGQTKVVDSPGDETRSGQTEVVDSPSYERSSPSRHSPGGGV